MRNMQMRFADSVWHRVVQIVQESMMTGTDCADLLRQVRVVPDSTDPNVLVLTSEYEAQVREMHENMLRKAKEMQAAMASERFVIPGTRVGGSN